MIWSKHPHTHRQQHVSDRMDGNQVEFFSYSNMYIGELHIRTRTCTRRIAIKHTHTDNSRPRQLMNVHIRHHVTGFSCHSHSHISDGPETQFKILICASSFSANTHTPRNHSRAKFMTSLWWWDEIISHRCDKRVAQSISIICVHIYTSFFLSNTHAKLGSDLA